MPPPYTLGGFTNVQELFLFVVYTACNQSNYCDTVVESNKKYLVSKIANG